MLIGALLGAGIAAAFFAWDRSIGAKKPVGAVCEGCKHHRSFHVNPDVRGESACVAMVSEVAGRCRCQHYYGPTPIYQLVDPDY